MPKHDELRLAKLSLELSDELILWMNPDARLLYGNAALCRALGYSPAELASLHVWDVSPRTQEHWPARFAEIKQNLTGTLVLELHSRDSEVVPVRLHGKYVSVEHKEYLIFHGRALHEQPEASPAPFESNVDAIFVLHKGQVTDSTRGSPDPHRESIRQNLETLLREPGTIHDRIARALDGEEVTFNWYSERPDGSRAHMECTLSRIEIEGHVRLLAIAVDITARRKSERTLAQLSGRLLQLQDEERRRIARDLHDATGQHLGALRIHLSTVLPSVAGLEPRARQAFEQSIELTETCIREMRTLSYLLHPPLLDELGLESALRAYSEGYSERTGIRLDVSLPAQMPRLPQAVEIALFRIVQEGLSNIHRHSESQTALIRLKRSRDSVELEIVDHGRGLPPGTLEFGIASASRIGVGIAGMHERARQLGGRLTIASRETGTTLRVVLPRVLWREL
jgi:PAS domain S-box-containing protein